MHPRIALPLEEQPNHEARLLFFSLLDAEWPALKESLIDTVWPAYRACWQHAPTDTPWPRRGRIRKWFLSASKMAALEAPAAIGRWSNLRRNRNFSKLRRALLDWAGSNSILRRDWMLDSALATLGKCFGDRTDNAAIWWRYGYQQNEAKWGLTFEPKFVGTIAHPEEAARWLPEKESYFGTREQFERRMRNQFERELSRYCKGIMSHWGLNKGRHILYARWTVARLSGLTWRQVVARFPAELDRYTEPVTHAKKQVRDFLKEIDPTLADSLAPLDTKPAKTGHIQAFQNRRARQKTNISPLVLGIKRPAVNRRVVGSSPT